MFGTSSTFGNLSAVTLNNTAGVVLNVNGQNVQVGSLAGGGSTGGNVGLGSGTLTVGGNNTSTNYAGVISGGGGNSTVALYKQGTGTFQLQHQNTFTGNIVIDGGVLEYNTDNMLGAVPGSPTSNNISIINGGTLYETNGNDDGADMGANRGIYLGPGTETIETASGDFHIAGVISGPGGLNKTRPGAGYNRLYLDSPTGNTFTGDTYWSGGTDHYNYSGIDMDGHPLALQNSALNASSIGSYLGVATTSGTLQLGGLLDGTGTVRSLASLTNNGSFTTLQLNPTIAGVVKSYSGVIGGTGEASTNVVKTGAGIQALNGANTYTGYTSVLAGQLNFNTIQNVGGGNSSLATRPP